MKIAFFAINDWEITLLKKRLKGHSLSFFNYPLTTENLVKKQNYDVVSVFISSKIDKAVLKKLPKLKFISTRSTGFDHINMGDCRKKKIAVANVPYYGENTVAEHTFALILALSRNVHKAYVRGLRDDHSIEGLKGFDLAKKTIGVIGAGNIGLHVIRIAKGFGMEVLATDTNQDNFLAEVLGFRYTSLKNLLAKSDIITIHTPYNKSTHHLINKSNIKYIKRGAILINTARGAIVDTDALAEALDKNIIAGAGLDVIEGENLIMEEKQLLYEKQDILKLTQAIKSHILLDRDDVVFTPHIAFYSQEALERILNTTIDNIIGFLNKEPQNII